VSNNMKSLEIAEQEARLLLLYFFTFITSLQPRKWCFVDCTVKSNLWCHKNL